MFSELESHDNIDGLSYTFVADKDEFNRSLGNLQFEYITNHENSQINLTITDYISSHCQRIMRSCRQSGEHLALAGKPGIGRYQCIKLASFGIIGVVSLVILATYLTFYIL